MTPSVHPAATHHLPLFVTAPGQPDVLFVVMGFFVLLTVIAVGIFYFKLHALPEHLAHGGQKMQYQIVSVLVLLALFTHNHAFWVAGLLLALIPIPDITTPLSSMAHSLDRIARNAEPVASPPPVQEAPVPAAEQPVAQQED
jgi:hypothetical protein